MVGQLLAGTEEAPGDSFLLDKDGNRYSISKITFGDKIKPTHKSYRGSASKESYQVQDKIASHRAPEGDSTLIECKGPVTTILEQLQAGVKSGMSYVGARSLKELRENSEFIQITNNGHNESKSHGKN